jgi:G3E family GTPase
MFMAIFTRRSVLDTPEPNQAIKEQIDGTIPMNRFAFLSQTSDRARIPVALLSGFLGSGKTTLVNALLRDPRMAGTAVAVNEFGDVPLDQNLIDHGADKTVVLANGCLCCNLAGDMEDAVMRLFSRREGGEVPRFERLVIEPSGLSDPAPIAQAILRNPMMSRVFRLEAIVTVVDAMFAPMQAERHPEWGRQVALADRLVVSKADLVDGDAVEEVQAAVRRFSSTALVEASFGAVDAALLFPPSFFDLGVAALGRSVLFAESIDPGHAGRYATVSLVADRPLDWRGFEAWLRGIRIAHAKQLLRVKGMLDIDGVDGPVVVQGVHHVLNAPVELDAWPNGGRVSRLVLIADQVTVEVARRSWADALAGMTRSRGRDPTRQDNLK